MGIVENVSLRVADKKELPVFMGQQSQDRLLSSSTDRLQKRPKRQDFEVHTSRRDPGPRFVANSKRLAVSLTRQTDTLFLVGDIKTGAKKGKNKKNKREYFTGDDGAAVMSHGRVFREVLATFEGSKRVVEVPITRTSSNYPRGHGRILTSWD